MQAYSMDLRERALLDSDAGMQAADVAVKYRVSGSWVRLLKQRRRETGEVAPRVQRHGRRRMLEPHLHTLAALRRPLSIQRDPLALPRRLSAALQPRGMPQLLSTLRLPGHHTVMKSALGAAGPSPDGAEVVPGGRMGILGLQPGVPQAVLGTRRA